MYDWVCTVTERVKVSCGLGGTTEEGPWQAVCALGEEKMYPVLGDEPARGMATRTRGQTKKDKGQGIDGGTEKGSGAKEDGRRAA